MALKNVFKIALLTILISVISLAYRLGGSRKAELSRLFNGVSVAEANVPQGSSGGSGNTAGCTGCSCAASGCCCVGDASGEGCAPGGDDGGAGGGCAGCAGAGDGGDGGCCCSGDE